MKPNSWDKKYSGENPVGDVFSFVLLVYSVTAGASCVVIRKI